MSRTTHDHRSHLELITIYEICRILGASLDIGRTFRGALNVMAAHVGLDRAMIVLPDAEEGRLRVHCSIGLTREQEERGVWKHGEGVIGHVFATGMPVVVPDVAQAPEFIDRTQAFGAAEGQMMAFVVVPLKTDNAVVGVLAAQRAVKGGARLADDQRILTMVATLLAQAASLHRAVSDEHRRLQQETTRLQKALQREPRGRYVLDNVIGHSRPMQQVFAEVHQAAPSRATVLLRGESGTGKEAVARAIHFLSPRKDAPFIKVNCAALTESLLESELFGHEKGSFTGAVGDRKGRFELAHGGTLFLDEIGDVSPAFQAKLLRVLQEREFERVGGSKAVKVDVRLICATNRDLEKMVQRGEYRADLYYRINVVSITLPPLRERREDIPPLVAHFIDRFNKENRRELKVTPEAMKVLSACYWPGNVRELENCVERTATMVQGDTIRDLAFPCRQNRCLTQTLHFLDKADAVAAAAPSMPSSRGSQPVATAPSEVTRIGPTHSLPAAPQPASADAADPPQDERDRLIWAMEQCGWVQAKAARLLRVTPRQLGYALQKNRIEVRKF
ncbi:MULTISPECIES: nif-specific transcriptional activator NifA [Roseateles]|uniref:Nif-specific regulatory protein n=1 Tax=Pelomonas caseinilytica TaxID=2906763 RepID=A0ABS8XL51_9BURK|nr:MULTISPECIES: nif-specific transcriptional activator NifA [unclassified Roseateles]MCE4537960.1 nif-specific transcriptional activator NifA [Pelomonas sp. P7]HEV6965986.1 nif-specific transcriptional activator NifA [Roseateles sp.]